MADTALLTRRSKPWALTFFSLLAIGGLVAMPFIAGEPDGDKMPDIVRFIGHFHPVLLHLPIGVFILIIVQELGAIFGRRHHESVANNSMFPLFFGAASSIVAVIAGFLLYQGHGDDYTGNAIAERHLWGGLIFAVAAVLTFILKAWTVSLGGNPAFYRLILFASVSIMGFASHDGASLTHGEDYLTKYAPEPIREMLGLKTKKASKPSAPEGAPVTAPTPDAVTAAPAGEAGKTPAPVAATTEVQGSIYDTIIHPMFERRCVQCHKAGKAKGKYRMDTYEVMVKGGKEGAGLVPGKPAESNVLIRMELPEDDEERMPPEGKKGLEVHELAVVKWWIENGADPKKTLNDFTVPAPIQEAISKIAPGSASSAAEPEAGEGEEAHAPAPKQDEALKTAVADISKEYPGALTFESQQSQLLTFTAVSLRGNLDDAGFKKIEAVTPQLVTVDLSATKITDQGVAQLETAKSLRLVRLAETGITDAAIDTLLKLPALESVNLYGTKVTDAGVSKLSSLANLKHLYLWKTAVTPEAIKALQEKLPNCEIVTGVGE